jgi:hypothetical protein
MIQDTYPCYTSKNETLFVFNSEGIQGTIAKIIIFTPNEEENEWNLAFGDFKNRDIDDSIITNNHDALKIMRTVAYATLEFLKKYPQSVIVIEPVDEKRGMLYNYVFQKNYNVINVVFDIIGLKGEMEETYSPTENYVGFKISLKSK